MDEQQILTATRGLSIDDVVLFLNTKGARIVCPMCEGQEWTLVEPNSAGVSMIPLQKEENYQLPPPSVPSVAIICNQCAFIRLHAAMPIASWKLQEGEKNE